MQLSPLCLMEIKTSCNYLPFDLKIKTSCNCLPFVLKKSRHQCNYLPFVFRKSRHQFNYLPFVLKKSRHQCNYLPFALRKSRHIIPTGIFWFICKRHEYSCNTASLILNNSQLQLDQTCGHLNELDRTSCDCYKNQLL
jgi:hypothetical protein